MLNLLRVALISALMGFLFGLHAAERRQRAAIETWKTNPDMLDADLDFQQRLKHDRRLWEIYTANRALYGE